MLSNTGKWPGVRARTVSCTSTEWHNCEIPATYQNNMSIIRLWTCTNAQYLEGTIPPHEASYLPHMHKNFTRWMFAFACSHRRYWRAYRKSNLKYAQTMYQQYLAGLHTCFALNLNGNESSTESTMCHSKPHRVLALQINFFGIMFGLRFIW